MVHNTKAIVDILPSFFSQTKYRSFQRQLNMWHFKRIPCGPYKGGFIHPLFQRGRKDLCSKMSRNILDNTWKENFSLENDLSSGSLKMERLDELFKLKTLMNAALPTIQVDSSLPTLQECNIFDPISIDYPPSDFFSSSLTKSLDMNPIRCFPDNSSLTDGHQASSLHFSKERNVEKKREKKRQDPRASEIPTAACLLEHFTF